MNSLNPPALLKPLSRFLKAAKQIEKYQPVMAYYCKLHSAKLGMDLRGPSNEPTVIQFLTNLLDELEDSKTALGDQLKEEHAKQLVTNFALKVFKIADDVDRSGKADKRTARDFLHASIFLEVCSQFGELSVEMEGYKKYAKWKAVQISQCLANGEIPPAGPIGWEDKTEDFEVESMSSDFPPQPSFSPPPASLSPPEASFTPPATSLFPGVPNGLNSSTPGFGMDVEVPGDVGFPDIPEVPSFVQTNPSSRPSAPSSQNWPNLSEDPFRQQKPQSPQQPHQPKSSQQQTQQQLQQQQLLQEQQRLQDQIRLLEQQRLEEQQRAQEQQRFQQLELRKQQLQQQQLLQQMQNQQQKTNNNTRTLGSSGGPSNGVPSSASLNNTARQILQQQEWRPTYQPDDYVPDEDTIIDATQHAKYVLSALQFDDVPTAIKYLCYCLKKLTGDETLFSQSQ